MIAVRHDESHEHRRARFARIRRTKWLLRFTPRRARLQHYPLIGRFADFARKRSYLWSFRSEHVRPAFYVGSIIALMPIMGIQIPIAFAIAVLLRSNIMILGGLQFISNPLTAYFIYRLGTYELGKFLLGLVGVGDTDGSAAAAAAAAAAANPEVETTQMTFHWASGALAGFNALIVGGIVAGAILGLVLDLLWRFGARQAAAHRVKVEARRHGSDSTPLIASAS